MRLSRLARHCLDRHLLNLKDYAEACVLLSQYVGTNEGHTTTTTYSPFTQPATITVACCTTERTHNTKAALNELKHHLEQDTVTDKIIDDMLNQMIAQIVIESWNMAYHLLRHLMLNGRAHYIVIKPPFHEIKVVDLILELTTTSNVTKPGTTTVPSTLDELNGAPHFAIVTEEGVHSEWCITYNASDETILCKLTTSVEVPPKHCLLTHSEYEEVNIVQSQLGPNPLENYQMVLPKQSVYGNAGDFMHPWYPELYKH